MHPYDVRERACQGEHPRTTAAYQDRRLRVLDGTGQRFKAVRAGSNGR